MSLVKLNQYPKHSVPLEVQGQIDRLKQEVNLADRPVAERLHGLICTLTLSDKVIAYTESDLSYTSPTLDTIVVAPYHQRAGLGTIILTHTLRKLASLGHKQLNVSCEYAQAPFFERIGFSAMENAYRPSDTQALLHPSLEATLHFLPDETLQKGNLKLGFMSLNQDSESYYYTEEGHYLGLHQLMLNQARKRVWIMCDTIRNPILDNEQHSQALQRLIRRNPQAEIRFLLTNDKQGAGYFNPCINLAQKLSSYIEIRTLQNSGRVIKEMITLVDYSASIFRKTPSDHSGFACFHNRLLYERMRINFDNHWQFAKPSQELRRLVI